MQVKSINLKDAKLNELGQVPFIQYIELWNRLFRLVGAAVFAGIGTGSIAIGFSVLLGLSVILGAIDKTKSN